MSSYSSSSSSSSSSSTITVDDRISAVHQDIIQTHILTRLDGPALAATSCASSQLHALSTRDDLWRQICTAAWPSITDENVSRVVSTFPAGHRSFFSDAFPVLDHLHQPSKRNLDHYLPNELISCVDVFYKNALIISKTHVTETATRWFYTAPFRVDLFDSKESILTPMLHGSKGDTWLKDLEENLTLSWIVIDPFKKRAVNISSGRAVTVERQWLAGDVLRARFATIMAGDYNNNGRSGSSETEYVKCEVAITCVGSKMEGGEVHVREVSMQLEDMEGRSMSGRDSLVILLEAMENGKRRKSGEGGQNGKVRYEEFVERKRVRKEKKDKMERVLDIACMCFGVAVFFALWSFLLLW